MELSTVRRPGEGAPLRDESAQLLATLDAFKAEPHRSLLAMQDEMGVDLGLRLGFEPGLASTDPDQIMQKPLSAEQYEMIKSFEGIARIFCEHSIYSPRELGDWLNKTRRAFHYKTSMDVLFEDFTGDGFNQQNVMAVLREGEVTFGLHTYNDAYLESLLNR